MTKSKDKVTITINTFNSNKIGHANYSITGTINGKTYDNDVVIGVNLNEGKSGTTAEGLLNAITGSGHMRDESHYTELYDHTKTVIELKGDQLTEAVKKEAIRQILRNEEIVKKGKPKKINYDGVPDSSGTHCFEFLIAMIEGSEETRAPEDGKSPGLGVKLLDHLDGKTLSATAGGRQALELLVRKEMRRMEEEADGPRKQAIARNRELIVSEMERAIKAKFEENPDAAFNVDNFKSSLKALVTPSGEISISAMAETLNNLSLTPSGNTERFNDRASSVRAGTAIYEDIEKENTPWWQGVDPLNLDKGENPAFADELKHLRGLDPDMSADDYAQSETANLIKQGVESGLDLLPDPENPESFKSAFDPGNYAANHDLSMTPEQWEAAQRSNMQQEAGSEGETRKGQGQGQELQPNAAQSEDAASLQYRNQGVEPKLNQTLDQAQAAALSAQHRIPPQQGFIDDEALSPYDTPFYDPTSRVQYYMKWEAEQKARQEQARQEQTGPLTRRPRHPIYQTKEVRYDDPPPVIMNRPARHDDPVEIRDRLHRYPPYRGPEHEPLPGRAHESRIQGTPISSRPGFDFAQFVRSLENSLGFRLDPLGLGRQPEIDSTRIWSKLFEDNRRGLDKAIADIVSNMGQRQRQPAEPKPDPEDTLDPLVAFNKGSEL